jgi:hypothetical protein
MTPAQQRIRSWRENVAQFAHEEFGFEPDPWQKELFDVFPLMDPEKTRISLQACAGPGKSAAMVICGWHFLATQGDFGEHPKGAAVSITNDNLKDNLWAEFAKWQGKSKTGYTQNAFTWTKTRIFANHHPETWFISARSFSKSANADEVGRTLSGLHSKYVLYIIDESGDIPPAIVKSAEQGLSTGPVFGKILQAGNPTSHTGMLYAASTKLRAQWYIIKISGDPEDPKRSTRINIEWAREQIKTYGRENPWVMAYILGQFPPSSINTLLSPEEVERAMSRTYRKEEYDHSQKRIGVDVARFGTDSTVLFPRQGLMAFKPEEMRGARSNEIAARIVEAKRRWGSEIEFVDGTGGYGSGVIDSLIQARSPGIEVNFAGKALNERYLNKRAEMWFEMAEWVKRGGCLPNIPRLVTELTAPTYTFQNGKFKLEEKAQIKDRLGYSVDYADALALTFALPEQEGKSHLPEFLRVKQVKKDWDPLADKEPVR